MALVLAALVGPARAEPQASLIAAQRAQGKFSDDGAQTRALKSVRLARDDAYFALDEEGASALQERLADALRAHADARGDRAGAPATLPPVLAIGAPGTVTLDRHDEIPLLLAHRTTGLRAWQVRPPLNLRLVAIDLRTGRVRTALLGATHRRKPAARPSETGTPPDATNAATVNVALDRHDVKTLPGLAWRPGRYALTVIEHDWVSNTVMIDLRGKDEGADAVASGDPSEAATAAVETRPPLAEEGLSLRVPARIAAGANLPVVGSVRLPTSSVSLRPPASKTATPLLPVCLLLVKLDASAPIQFDAAVPARRTGGTKPLVEAGFAIQLRPSLETASPGKYQVFLAVGPRVAGPYPLEILAP